MTPRLKDVSDSQPGRSLYSHMVAMFQSKHATYQQGYES